MQTIEESIFILEKQIKFHLELSNKNKVAILRMRLKRFKEIKEIENKINKKEKTFNFDKRDIEHIY